MPDSNWKAGRLPALETPREGDEALLVTALRPKEGR